MKRIALTFITISCLLFTLAGLLSNVQIVHAPAIPIPGGVNGEHYYQSHLWYAAGRWWLFYSNGVDAIYNSTTGGLSDWVGGALYLGVQHTQRIDTYYNGSHFHFVVADYSVGQPRYRLGEPRSDGTINWAAAWQYPGGTQTTELSVTADSEGYPWICYNYNTEQSLAVTTSTARDGTWSTRSSFPHNLDTNVDPEGRVVALNGTAVYAIWKPKNLASKLRGKLWNGTDWESVEDVTISYAAWGYQFQALGFGNAIYLTFREDSTSHAYFVSKKWGESWSSEYDVSESIIVNTPSIIRREDEELWILWGDSEANIWMRCHEGTAWLPIRHVASEPVFSGGEACFETKAEVYPKIGLLFYGSLYFDVIGLADFDIVVSPSADTAIQGTTVTTYVYVSPIAGYDCLVSLSASGQPAGVIINFNPVTGTPYFTSTLTVQVEHTVPFDTYPITITGLGSDGKMHSVIYTLTVTGGAVPEFPIGLTWEMLLIPTIFYILWRSRQEKKAHP